MGEVMELNASKTKKEKPKKINTMSRNALKKKFRELLKDGQSGSKYFLHIKAKLDTKIVC